MAVYISVILNHVVYGHFLYILVYVVYGHFINVQIMSLAFVPTAQKGAMPNQTTIQKMLDENSQLIQVITDYQNQGQVEDAQKYQELLHRNLLYLASIADARLLQQLQNEKEAALEEKPNNDGSTMDPSASPSTAGHSIQPVVYQEVPHRPAQPPPQQVPQMAPQGHPMPQYGAYDQRAAYVNYPPSYPPHEDGQQQQQHYNSHPQYVQYQHQYQQRPSQ